MAASRVPGWVVLGFLACGTQDQLSLGAIPPEAGSTEGGAPAEASDESGLMLRQCVGLQCNVNSSCPNGGHTTLTGKVFDPAGQNPLYSVLVFVPTDPAGALPPIAPGTRTCNTCDASIGRYVAATTTDATGSFTLRDVPTGAHVPLVVQTGKWRRKQFIQTADCAETAVPQSMTRLPRNRSEGDMPQMALLTGGCDDMACFLLNLGIDASEFGAPPATLSATAAHTGGRVDVFQGNSMPLGVGGSGPSLSNGTAGNCTNTSCPLWASKSSFEYYDMAIFSCQCAEMSTVSESTAAYTNLHDWLNEGGKVFASHYHYTWFKNNPDPKWQATATWLGSSIAGGMGTYDVDTTFTKGSTFGQWMSNVGALSGNGPPPTLALSSVASSVSSVNTATTSRWIYDPNPVIAPEAGGPTETKYLSFLTPIGGITDGGAEGGSPESPVYCGKAVFTDLHTSSGLFAQASTVPSGCKVTDLTPQQKALEYLFFDLAACVAPEDKPTPMPPPNPPPPPPPPM
jgi:hypothetical protein